LLSKDILRYYLKDNLKVSIKVGQGYYMGIVTIAFSDITNRTQINKSHGQLDAIHAIILLINDLLFYFFSKALISLSFDNR